MRDAGGAVALAAMLAATMAACARAPADNAGGVRPGEPIAGLTEAELGRFLLGQAVFERLITPDEGLGPLFNADRCSACHDQPATGGSGVLLVHKATRWESGICDALESEGGDNLQQRATPLLAALGIQREKKPPRANGASAFTAPPLFGLGLIEAVAEADLLALEDIEDRDDDGITGRAGRTRHGKVGRFSRKADVATIRDFVETALRFEVGLTTVVNPHEETINGKPLPPGVDPMPEPEIEERGLSLLAEFAAYLAPPAREVPAAAADSIAQGESLFEEVGCATCHVPVLRTGTHEVDALRDREVRLYSDLLLHDLGPALADVCGAQASPAEWRTTPLWGLRFRKPLLHDGRATSPRDAILQHAGEADGARQRFHALSEAEQKLLLRFLASL
jgi:CxxC motif-containing protein (DUF1111 family)